MILKLVEIDTHHGTTYGTLELTVDGRTIKIESEHSHCNAEFHCDQDEPLQVGDRQVTPTQIADLAMLGSVIESGDTIEVTPEWLANAG